MLTTKPPDQKSRLDEIERDVEGVMHSALALKDEINELLDIARALLRETCALRAALDESERERVMREALERLIQEAQPSASGERDEPKEGSDGPAI